MAALDRAVTLAEVDDVSVRVRKHLHLDVARVDEEALDVDLRAGEVRLPLALRRLERALDAVGRLDDLHPLAAAAGRRLDQQREADLLAERDDLRRRVNRLGRAGDDRDAGGLHRGARGRLRAHQVDRRRRRPDPDEPCRLDGARERGVLRQEAVAGMNGCGTGTLSRVDQLLHDEVALGRRRTAERVGLVGVRDVRRAPVGVGIDRDGADSELAQRPEDADRNLATVGDQNLRERHGRILSRR